MKKPLHNRSRDTACIQELYIKDQRGADKPAQGLQVPTDTRKTWLAGPGMSLRMRGSDAAGIEQVWV